MIHFDLDEIKFTISVVIENDRVGRFPADVKRRVAVVEGDATLAKAVLVISDDDVWI